MTPATTQQTTGQDAYFGPALRRFKRGDEVTFYFMVYNAKRDKSKQSHLKIEMQAYRDGLEVHGASPVEVTAEGPKKEDVACHGVLKFHDDAPTGTYALRFVVIDQLARGKQSQASQWIDLEIL